MKLPINNLSGGMIADSPDINLPEGIWSDSRNVKYRDGAVEKCRGYTPTLGSLSATSIWASAISDGSNILWAYGSNTVLYGTDGTTHANISHPSLTYAATDDLGWTGGPFHGFLIANDGVNIPQSWDPGLANDFTSLTAWPATVTCKVIRPFKDFLFAFRNTTGGDFNPREIRWSDKAAQGALPQSWDYTDPTNQAGINELGQTDDVVVDALPLRDSLIIYKEYHTWSAEYVGGQDIFSFRQLFGHVGMLTENCAVAFNSLHFVLTDSDIVVHDGNTPTSIADKKMRAWLFNRINSTRFRRTFVVPDYRNREIYCCFAESGYDWPNLSLVWNWAENNFHVYELSGSKTFGASGILPGTSVTFDSESTTFDGGTGAFDDENYNLSTPSIVLLDSSAKLAYQNDATESYNGATMTCYANRTGILFELPSIKKITRLWPKVIGTAGDTLQFYIGVRTALSSTTTQMGPYTFTIGTDFKIDLRCSARVLDIKVQYSGTQTFRLAGLDIDFQNGGYR